ncbi:MAG: phosphate ABC transporter permease subunit PstC [Nanoarchaeota archaeon]|nr:phosphate ABC transporter permease subunit PstC [Nanoarchaeota archaeon]
MRKHLVQTDCFRHKEELIRVGLQVVSVVTLLILVGIFLFLFINAFDVFSTLSLKEFLLGREWNPIAYGQPLWGILGLLKGTFMVTFGGLLLALPIGLSTALYLSFVASRKVREIIKPVIELIASIPSVVLGLLGIVFLSPFIAQIFGLPSGLNALSASIVVAIMILPTIISISEDVLSSLPSTFMEASLALGATKWQTIKMVLFPAARSGILAAIMLALGRAVGETMAVLMVAGNARAFPSSFFDPVRPMTATIAIEIKEVVQGSFHYHALFAIGLVLFLLTFLINLIGDLIISKQVKKYRW